ncbi:MAG: SUMF1/EgtB/PvdO family nonheme iron enzyme [Candidatus Omnitrophica bacterium]|nr:SUMF1/EgtB/PvdO family nonheme iron enzyme [Candidatus Omnitrophota bacterium]
MLAVVVALLFPTSLALANNVTVSNAELVDQDASADTVGVEFDLAWSNAWKDSTNNDSVWVFAKYCTSNCSTNGTWSHATLKTSGTNPSGFDDGARNSGAFTALDIIVPADKKGAFIQPASVGSGTVDFKNIKLVWDYGQDGVSDENATGASTKIRVFAIEMVYIPEGGFYAGDGSTNTYGTISFGPAASSVPGAVTSEDALEFQNVGGTAAGLNRWYYNTDTGANDESSGATFQVGQPFPKGYKDFYVMKYEMSQGQYRDFLNTLSQPQQDARVTSDLSNENDANTYVMIAEGQGTVVSRQTIKAGSNPSDGNPYVFGCDLNDNDVLNEAGDGEWIAMNYLSWMDLCAYADWAALRPMTELEFEKVARGSLYPVTNEYVWGDASLVQAQGAISNSGQTNEVAANTGNGLANYDGAGTDTLGPLRSGFAATSSTTVRLTSGGSFYGVMDLSGNLWERVVTIGNSSGRGFSWTHGDGDLTTLASYEGNATNLDWPGISTTNNQGVTGASGSGSRGGAWNSTVTRYLTVSNRELAGTTDTTRAVGNGGRVVRTAP